MSRAKFSCRMTTSSALDVEDHSFSKDGSLLLIYTNSKRVWRTRSRGDYWILDRSSRSLRKLASHAAPSTTQFATISPDSTKVAYVVDGNIFVEDVRSGEVTQVTEKKSAKIINGTFDWVYEEEFGLRHGFRWSPDSQSIAYWQLDTTGVPVFTMINNTDSLYPKLITFAHPKTGQRNSACRVGVVSAGGGPTRWIKLEGDPRENYVARMDWAGNSRELVLQNPNRLQNNNRLVIANALSGDSRVVLSETDEAWVDVRDDLHWLEDGDSFTWTSERDGWRHIYVVSRDGKDTRQITRGDWDVISLVKVDEANGYVYFTASPGKATQSYLYRAMLDGSGRERITPERSFTGTNSYRISADAKLAVHSHSSIGNPPTTQLISLPGHETIRMLEENMALREKVDKLGLGPIELLQIETEDAVMDAWCIKPPKMETGKKYPLLCYVYGEPAGSTVRDSWGGSGYLWHAMLAQHGYIVVSIDNRGTRVAKGRDWRKSIYRKIGVIAPKDQAAAVRKLLKDRPYIDPDRIGVWGWSGGGSMALNAIFKYPRAIQDGDLDRAGAESAVLRHDLPGTLHGTTERQRGGLHRGLADQLRSPAQGQLAADPRHGRRQLPLPDDGNADQRIDPSQQAVLDDGVSQPQPLDPRRQEYDQAPARADDALHPAKSVGTRCPLLRIWSVFRLP